MAAKKKSPAKKAPRKSPAKRPAGKAGPKKGGKKWYPGGPAPTTAGRGRKAAPAKKSAPKKVAAKAAPAAPAAPAQPDTARPLALAIAKAGLDKKAEEVLLLDVRGLTSYADYFVVMTADSERQASAVADHLDDEMKKAGHTRVGVEGYEAGRWILVDYGDVVAHVMSREAREFYDIEGLWADAPRMSVAD